MYCTVTVLYSNSVWPGPCIYITLLKCKLPSQSLVWWLVIWNFLLLYDVTFGGEEFEEDNSCLCFIIRLKLQMKFYSLL